MVAVVCVLSSAGLASADDYPVSMIDRPLTLPESTFQPYAAFELMHYSSVPAPAPSNVELLQFSLDAGIAHHLQAGAFTTIEVSPQSQIFNGLANIQYQLLNFAAVRADIGIQRVDNGDVRFAVGIGLPVKLKLTDTVALISSRPYAYGAEDDIFSARVGSSSVSEFRIPVGLMFQLGPHLNVAARSGFRNQGSAEFVPIGGDVVASYGPADLGVTVDLAGQIAPSNGSGYADLLTVRAFAQLRL